MDERSDSLDLIRGLAALFVMAGHVRTVFFVPFGEAGDVGVIYSAFYFLTGYGHECVIIFFVLSGYFVGSAFHRNRQLANYSVNRLSRLWVVLLPALILTVGLDTLGMYLNPSKSFYTIAHTFRFIDPSNDRSLLTFIGNVFFLQTVEVPTFGSNAPLWSLANEFWYYVLFPACYFLFAKGSSSGKRLASALIAAVLLYWLGMKNLPLALGFFIWLMGYGAWLVSWKPGMIVRIVFVLIFLAVCVGVRIYQTAYDDFILGIAATGLVVAVRDIRLGHLGPVAVFLSRISYTLYLIHLPLIIFLAATVLYGTLYTPNPLTITYFFAIALAILVFSWLFYYVFERNTDVVRRYIKSSLFNNLTSKSVNPPKSL